MVLTDHQLREQLMATQLQSRGKDWYSIGFTAMGTTCRVDFAAPSFSAAIDFKDICLQWLADFEVKYSRYRLDSMISEVNRAAGKEAVPIDDELESMFRLCDWFHWLTRGVFDPTLLPLSLLWDYHPECPVIPAKEAIERAREHVGWLKVQRDTGRVYLPEKGMAIDTDGFGKEYAVDRVAEMALQRGIEQFVVDFGQDLRVHGKPPEAGEWRIGLEHPEDPGRCWCGVALRDRAVATSGDYLRNFFQDGVRYGHILDPRTGYPVQHACGAVSVVAPTCVEAGIIATAAFVLGPEKGLLLIEDCHHVEGCMWLNDRRLRTSGFDRYVIQSTTV